MITAGTEEAPGLPYLQHLRQVWSVGSPATSRAAGRFNPSTSNLRPAGGALCASKKRSTHRASLWEGQISSTDSSHRLGSQGYFSRLYQWSCSFSRFSKLMTIGDIDRTVNRVLWLLIKFFPHCWGEVRCPQMSKKTATEVFNLKHKS